MLFCFNPRVPKDYILARKKKKKEKKRKEKKEKEKKFNSTIK